MPNERLVRDILTAQASDELFAFIDAKFDGIIEGIVFAGSRVYGVPREDSDLDIVVALSRPIRTRIVRRFDLLVDISALYHGEIRRAFEQSNSPGLLACMARGIIIADTTGKMKDLQALAKSIYSHGPPPPSSTTAITIRARLTRELDSLPLIEDDFLFSMAVSHILEDAAMAYCSFSRIWPPSPKNLFEHLSPTLKTLAERAAEADSREKLQLVQRFIMTILEPVGGPLREWETPIQNIRIPVRLGG